MYIVGFLERLTQAGVLKWTTDIAERWFKTTIGGFTLRLYEEKRFIRKKGFFGERMVNQNHIVLRTIDPNGGVKELAGAWGGTILGMRLNDLLHEVDASCRESIPSIYGNLYLEALRTFNLQP